MKSKHARGLVIALAMAGFSAISACSAQTDEPVPPAPTARDKTGTPTAGTSTIADHDRPSPPTISVGWDENATAPSPSAVLTGVVRNSSKETKAVQLRVVGIDPNGTVVMRPLEPISVPPRSSASFRVPVVELPVQSVGLDSKISILATYELSAPLPDGTTRKFSHQVHSAPLHVSFDEAMANATVLTTAEQARANGLRFGGRAALHKVARLRHYDLNRGAMQEQQPLRSSLTTGEAVPLPVITVSDVGPGREPALPTPSTGN